MPGIPIFGKKFTPPLSIGECTSAEVLQKALERIDMKKAEMCQEARDTLRQIHATPIDMDLQTFNELMIHELEETIRKCEHEARVQIRNERLSRKKLYREIMDKCRG